MSGVPLVVVSLVRVAPEMSLLCMMATGLFHLEKSQGRAALGGCTFALCLASAAASLLAGLCAVPYFAAIDFLRGFTLGFSLIAHIALCALLAVSAFLPEPAAPPAKPTRAPEPRGREEDPSSLS